MQNRVIYYIIKKYAYIKLLKSPLKYEATIYSYENVTFRMQKTQCPKAQVLDTNNYLSASERKLRE
jgi:hypothetical protein